MLSQDWRGAVRFGVPGLVLGLALAWGTGGGQPLQAQGAVPAGAGTDRPRSAAAGETSGTIAFTTPAGGSSSGAQLLYLIDTRQHALAIYRVDTSGSAKGTVKLEAARHYQWDLKLSDYNNQGLEPAAIEAAVRAGGLPKR